MLRFLYRIYVEAYTVKIGVHEFKYMNFNAIFFIFERCRADGITYDAVCLFSIQFLGRLMLEVDFLHIGPKCAKFVQLTPKFVNKDLVKSCIVFHKYSMYIYVEQTLKFI